MVVLAVKALTGLGLTATAVQTWLETSVGHRAIPYDMDS